jgi:tetratricopeptide (TPR) repeat protein
MRSKTPRTALAAVTLALFAASFAACASTRGREPEERDVGWLIAHGEHDRALDLAARRKEERPNDPAAESDHRLASAAWLVARGRELTFEDRDEEALELFRQAHELAPGVPEIGDWVARTSDKLARQAYEEALEWQGQDDLEEARAAYERALSYNPDDARAKQGLQRVLLHTNYRAGMGEKYYRQGIRALDDYWLEQARGSFAYTLKYAPDDARARQRRTQIEGMLADERYEVARAMEAQDLFAAARNEYRLTLLIDPEHDQARLGLERMEREQRSSELLRRAQQLILARRFDEAVASLAEAAELSALQTEELEGARAAVQEARLGQLYDVARALETDNRFEEAIAAYGDLLERAPFYRDAIARRDTLEDYVADAQRLYAQAAATQDLGERETILRRFDVFWPEYRDVREQLRALEAARTAPEAAPAPSPEPPSDPR